MQHICRKTVYILWTKMGKGSKQSKILWMSFMEAPKRDVSVFRQRCPLRPPARAIE